MQTSPNNFDSIYEEGNYLVEYKVNIDGTDYDQSKIWSMKTSRALFTEDTTLIGNALTGQIDLKITHPGITFSRMAKIKPYIRLYSRTRNIYSGWAQKGEFFIDTRSSNESDDIVTIEIEGYDAMRKADQPYPSSTLEWSATSPTAKQVVQEIANHIGVPVDQRTSTLLDSYPRIIKFPEQYTMSEALCSIAVMYGGNFIITDTGKLHLAVFLELEQETELLMNERGNYITFGGVRIKLRAGG